MILQALTRHYETLVRRGEIAAPGWGPVKVSYALCIAADGTLERVISVQTEQVRGKKTVLAPQIFSLPAPVKRTVGVAANFLCDNASYFLGADNKGKPARTAQCFAVCKALHEQLLQAVDTPAARAVLAFFRNWDPAQAQTQPALAAVWEDILAGANLIFRHANAYVHDDPAVRQAWEQHYGAASDAPAGRCLVTGENAPIESTHPAIKNVAGAQSSGAALVSFNAPAFCSYGKEQNFNAPTGQYASFAYTSALNHLLADRDHVYRIGDATVVCWAENGAPAYNILFGGATFGAPAAYSDTDFFGMVKALCAGQPVTFEEEKLDRSTEFYVLGLSPNAARLSVRFFLHNSFGAFLDNIAEHCERLEIVRPSYDKTPALSVWRLLNETVNQNARDKSPAPNLAGETVRAVLNDTRYPATLLNGVTLRIRAEREVTRGRAAILKAYYIKNPHPDVPKEVLTVSLNPDATHAPYLLGRLFSVLEAIQSAANPGINATIKDKYFNSAAATPALVFPTLIGLAQKHLKKLGGSAKGLAVSYDKQLGELLDKLGTDFPARMNLQQQGSFQLGYYQQTQARYQKKEEN